MQKEGRSSLDQRYTKVEGAHIVCALEVFDKLKKTTHLCEQTKESCIIFILCGECLCYSQCVAFLHLYWKSKWLIQFMVKHIMPELIPQKNLILGNEELYCNLVILYFHTIRSFVEVNQRLFLGCGLSL